ncbi:hypothetical protein MHP7448_0689 [Mesomycoplasma hyopneumoniae 7448]|uniref:Transmembrane protein n=1 Tax=Mesomycoplasma hyopneumoniae (strain 7448) TaxID=262722 RepID=A4Q7V6_MESH7|nr:hypothetical protein MHP7448_0689 [Mesomycoplasma hyopneumoniae 7448]
MRQAERLLQKFKKPNLYKLQQVLKLSPLKLQMLYLALLLHYKIFDIYLKISQIASLIPLFHFVILKIFLPTLNHLVLHQLFFFFIFC